VIAQPLWIQLTLAAHPPLGGIRRPRAITPKLAN
jgi:hypothetical protein